ncbi:hypothetical protein ABTX60_05370 [Streptomyces sp. NPDC126510]|uniref:hypothetical protein n=1 Tax=Streptomyces sp. NPDC126510 TaxID=3155317 RepID=UPI00332D37A3
MAHVEPAHLVELALGNATPTEADTEALRHVDQCARCRDELRVLTRLVNAARTARLVDLPTAPPERVWRRISRGISPETNTPEPPPRVLDRRTRAVLAVLALATTVGAAVALRCLHERSRVVRCRVIR